MRYNSEKAGATRVKFRQLSLQVQERLLKRQAGEGEGFVIETGGILMPAIIVALAVAWFVLLYLLSNDFLWNGFKIGLFSLLSLFASYYLIHGGYTLFRSITSRSRSCLLITPHYVIHMDFDDILYWDLDDLRTVDSARRSQNGVYKFTEITLGFENGSKTFRIKDIEAAEEAIDDIHYLRKLYIEATARQDHGYLDSTDDFCEVRNRPAQPAPDLIANYLKYPLTGALSLFLATGVMFAGISLNNYYDDKLSWELARSVDRSSAVRYYLHTHPHGRWRLYADERLQFLYDAAEQKYRASLNSGFDQKAADAVIAMLKYARTNNHCVMVTFERDNQIPATIVEDLKAEYQVDKMIGPGDSFSDEKMSRREGILFTSVESAVSQVIPNDILDISAECTGEAVQFRLKYEIGADSIYYDTSQKKLPDSERVYSPGIFILWNFGIHIPGAAEIYDFELESIPAKTIRHDGDYDEAAGMRPDFDKVLEANKDVMYDSMAASAFEDFRANLIFRMGIGDDKNLNINVPLEEETPPPDGNRQGIPVG